MSPNLVLPRLRNYIGSEFTEVMPTEMPLVDPSTGDVYGLQVTSDSEAIEGALAHAARCHNTHAWYHYGERRAEVLRAIADAISSHTEELAVLEAANTGVVLRQTRQLLALVPGIFRAAAEQVLKHPDRIDHDPQRKIEQWFKPWGPALALAPWNSPAPIGMHKLASALAAGAPVILKPSEFTPFTTQRIFELIAGLDLPRGAVQLLHGDAVVGRALASDTRVRAVSFTGGLAGGRAVADLCIADMKRFQLELGGHNPLIAMPDADAAEVASGIVSGLTTLNGQWCRAVGRVFLPRTLKSAVLAAFSARIEALRLGPALDIGSEMGPLIHIEHKRRLAKQLQGLVAAGGRRLGSQRQLAEDTCFMLPELVTGVTTEQDREELFGPLAVVHEYNDLLELKNAVAKTKYGLAAYIFGRDSDPMYGIARDMEVGSTKINGITLTSLVPSAARAAWGLSGYGEEGAFETMNFFRGSSLIGKAAH